MNRLYIKSFRKYTSPICKPSITQYVNINRIDSELGRGLSYKQRYNEVVVSFIMVINSNKKFEIYFLNLCVYSSTWSKTQKELFTNTYISA